MAKSVIDAALANIDAQIADLERAKALIVNASAGTTEDAPKVKRTRKPRSKPGLPDGTRPATQNIGTMA